MSTSIHPSMHACMHTEHHYPLKTHAPSLVRCTAALIAFPSMLLYLSFGVNVAVTVKMATLVLAAPIPPGGFHMMTLSLSSAYDEMSVLCVLLWGLVGGYQSYRQPTNDPAYPACQQRPPNPRRHPAACWPPPPVFQWLVEKGVSLISGKEERTDAVPTRHRPPIPTSTSTHAPLLAA